MKVKFKLLALPLAGLFAALGAVVPAQAATTSWGSKSCTTSQYVMSYAEMKGTRGRIGQSHAGATNYESYKTLDPSDYQEYIWGWGWYNISAGHANGTYTGVTDWGNLCE
jgi:hypothetical protein